RRQPQATQLVIGKLPAAGKLVWLRVTHTTCERGDEVVVAGGVPVKQPGQCRQTAIASHWPIVIGNVIERAAVLAAPNFSDWLPPQSPVQQFEIGPTLRERAQLLAFALQILLSDGLQRIGFGRAPCDALLPFLGRWIDASLGFSFGSGGKLTRRSQGQRRVKLGRRVRPLLPVGEGRPERQFPRCPPDTNPGAPGLVAGGPDDEVEPPAPTPPHPPPS